MTAASTDNELLAKLRNGDWLDRQAFDPMQYIVPGVLPEGYTLLVGPPKVGKSWLVLALALALASGGRVLGLEVERRPVLYLALEDGDRRMQDRCRQLLPKEPIPPAFEYMTQLAKPGHVVPTIEAWLEGVGSGVVILDTLGRVMPEQRAGESAYQRDYRVGAALKRLVDDRPGSSLIVNHHDRKATAEDFVDSVSGTHGLAGAADTIVTLSRARSEPSGVLRVTGRDVAEGEYAVAFDGTSGTWSLGGDDLEAAAANAVEVRATAGVGDVTTKVIRFVGDHPKGVRAKDVEEALGQDARRYLARAADAGRIRRVGRGLYAPNAPVPSVPTSHPDDEGDGTRDTWDTPTEDPT